MKLLLVEDERKASDSLHRGLSEQGHASMHGGTVFATSSGGVNTIGFTVSEAPPPPR